MYTAVSLQSKFVCVCVCVCVWVCECMGVSTCVRKLCVYIIAVSMQTGHQFHHSTISFIPFITSIPNLHPHSTHTPSYETALFQRALTHVTSFIHFLFNQKYTSLLHYLMLCVLENELFFLFSLHSVLSAFNWRLNYFFAFIFFSLSLSLFLPPGNMSQFVRDFLHRCQW